MHSAPKRIRRRWIAGLIGALMIAVFGVGSALAAIPVGQTRTGKMTWYNDAGYGSCGTSINAATEELVAVAQHGVRTVDLVLPDAHVGEHARRQALDEILADEVRQVSRYREDPARHGVGLIDGGGGGEHEQAGVGDADQTHGDEAETPRIAMEVDREHAERRRPADG